MILNYDQINENHSFLAYSIFLGDSSLLMAYSGLVGSFSRTRDLLIQLTV